MSNDLSLQREQRARQLFFEQGFCDLNIFPEEIYDSWRRCLAHHLDPAAPMKKVLSKGEFKMRCDQNAQLLSIAVPFMELLYQVVKDTDFSIMLSDSDGYILKLIGDPSILRDYKHKDNPLVEGSCRSENIFGTNGIGTSLALRKPIQLTPNQHFRLEPHPVSGTGAPIILANGTPIGALSMSGPPNKVHRHTLGMITAASRAIEEQFALQQTNTQLATTKNQLQTILDTFDQGVFLIDSNYTIIDANRTAQKLLGFGKHEIINQSVFSFIKKLDFSNVESAVYDVELSFHTRFKTENFFVTLHRIDQDAYHSFLIVFRESERVHNLVNKYIGSNAYFTFDDIIGESTAIVSVKENAQIAAQNGSNVLLVGESGTGKELFAQSIHNSSSFCNGPFIAVNCGAIPRTLIESELFGYESGAFTGAKRSGNAGKFELANNGTIFLDEIGDMPYEVQIDLLRILQTREVTRIGGTKPIPLNIRIIAATNVDLEQAIAEKTFRRDLYYRLNVLTFHIPPLREREQDALLLADYFIQKYQQPHRQSLLGISPSVRQLFLQYPWPGNIRELENTIERACLLTQEHEISPKHLPINILKGTIFHNSASSQRDDKAFRIQIASSGSSIRPVEAAEKELIETTLKICCGNIKETAERLGLSRRTLYRKVDKYHIDYYGIRKLF
ncbi:sigma 54-interacting transcriptional regulator [Agathobaculum sp. NTUH-O15-33]|uniref:sigma-54-dependent Fis family transcriptional regulator n=1 Tax=Agathobaculum sp. NTUH-O15-33 TaxID=3079302 RepID=UPI002958C9D5|nr:sigma 54-interacting transcriptional regulator [Agathobaculum sp. NTUH-O15-33]WNX83332.1 sigma 54-interacting transcriptional regulator [Agathobaculum sp. NTUH-O15-33]